LLALWAASNGQIYEFFLKNTAYLIEWAPSFGAGSTYAYVF
jgi:hypothetical protein